MCLSMCMVCASESERCIFMERVYRPTHLSFVSVSHSLSLPSHFSSSLLLCLFLFLYHASQQLFSVVSDVCTVTSFRLQFQASYVGHSQQNLSHSLMAAGFRSLSSLLLSTLLAPSSTKVRVRPVRYCDTGSHLPERADCI